MLRLDILPRLVPDSHCETREEAIMEVTRRRASPAAHDAVTRFAASPYGGYRVYTVSLEMAMEVFADMVDSGVSHEAASLSESGYGKAAAYQ